MDVRRKNLRIHRDTHAMRADMAIERLVNLANHVNECNVCEVAPHACLTGNTLLRVVFAFAQGLRATTDLIDHLNS